MLLILSAIGLPEVPPQFDTVEHIVLVITNAAYGWISCLTADTEYTLVYKTDTVVNGMIIFPHTASYE